MYLYSQIRGKFDIRRHMAKMGVSKKKYKLIFTFLLLIVMAGCSSDDTVPDKFEGVKQDSELVGEWTAQKTGAEGGIANKIVLSDDGNGSYIKQKKTGSLRWGTKWEDEKLFLLIELDDGTISESSYSVNGAILTFNDKEYTINIPILGEWFISKLNTEKQSSYNFSINFRSQGDAYYRCFDNTGIVKQPVRYTWQRAEDGGIQVIVDGMKKHFSYQVDGDVLTLDNGEQFIRDNKWSFYGKWKSVYNEEGKLAYGQYPYSTLSMFHYESTYKEKNHIVIDYFTQNGNKGRKEYIWDDFSGSNMLYLHMNDDELIFNYRLRYNFSDQIFYLELSENEQTDFNRFVGYVKTDNEQ